MRITFPYVRTLLNEGDMIGIVKAEEEFEAPLEKGIGEMVFFNFEMYQGENRMLRVFVKDKDGNPVNVAGAVATLSAKSSKSDAVKVLTKSTNVPGQGEIGSANYGEVLFYLVPLDTVALPANQYVWSVSITLANGKSYVILEGTFSLLLPVS